MADTRAEHQAKFYREFLMARAAHWKPQDFGIDVPKDEFMDKMVDEFNGHYRDGWTIDELLLHPRDALWFCDQVRQKFAYRDLPDDIILRAVLTRRKNPGG